MFLTRVWMRFVAADCRRTLKVGDCCALSNETTVELDGSGPTWMTVIGFDENGTEGFVEGGRWEVEGKGANVLRSTL
jgi:hypothetical protein